MLQRLAVLAILTLLPSSCISQGRHAVTESSITGTLRTDKGELLQGTVLAFQFFVKEGRFQPQLACHAATGKDGSFACPHLSSGTYLILASSFQRAATAAGQESPSAVSQEELPLFAIYPAVPDLDPLNFVALVQGEQRAITIPVMSGNVVPVLRVISAAGGVADKSLHLSLHGADFSLPLPLSLQSAMANGNYALKGLPLVPYELTENWTVDGVSHQAIAQAESATGRTILSVAKAYTLSGTVHFSNQLSPKIAELFLISATGEDLIRYVALVSKDGLVAFNNVRAGKYYVAFNPGDGLRLIRLSLGGKEQDGTMITVEEGGVPSPMSIVGEYAPATLKGSLKLNGTEPRPGVVFHSDDGHTDTVIRTNAEGSFKIDNLPAGHYQIFGWADLTSVPYENSHFMRRYSGKSLKLDVEPGATVTNLSIECIAATI